MRGSCLPEGPANYTIKSCIDTSTSYALSQINPGARMRVERSPTMDSVLCIAIDNSPLRGRYLMDPGAMSVDTLSLPNVRREFSYNHDVRPDFRSTHMRYISGDRIPVATFTGGSFHSISGGFWLSYGPDASKRCNLDRASHSILFGANKPPSTCFFEQTFHEEECDSRSLERLVSGLFMAKQPYFMASGGSSDFVQVSLNSVSVWDATTQTLSTLPTASFPTSTTWDAATCTCSSAILSILYTVNYDQGVVTSILADVVATDIEQDTLTCGTEIIELPFSSAVRFLSDSVPAGSTSFEQSNAHRYFKSGAPGYNFHSPLRGGVLISESESDTSGLVPLDPADKLAIEQVAASAYFRKIFAKSPEDDIFGFGGLQLIGPGLNGECSTFSTPFASTNPRLVPITFGDDLSVSCRVTLTRAELMNLCTINPPYAASLGFATVPITTSGGTVSVTPTHVAIYGNSDPWKSWEWLRISEPVALPSTPVYDPISEACSGFVTGVKFEVLWTRVAERSNSQPKILAVRKEYITDTLLVRTHDVSGGARPPRQSVLFKSTVTFVEYAAAEEDYVAPPRPLIPSVPSDIWYPFNTVGLRDNQIISGD